MTTPVRHYHHAGESDDLVIGHYLYDDSSTGVVVATDPEGKNACPVAVSELVPWAGGVR